MNFLDMVAHFFATTFDRKYVLLEAKYLIFTRARIHEKTYKSIFGNSWREYFKLNTILFTCNFQKIYDNILVMLQYKFQKVVDIFYKLLFGQQNHVRMVSCTSVMIVFSFTDTNSKNSVILHEVKYLLPIMLFFQLPPDYPSCSSPTFTISCKWLTLQQVNIF